MPSFSEYPAFDPAVEDEYRHGFSHGVQYAIDIAKRALSKENHFRLQHWACNRVMATWRFRIRGCHGLTDPPPPPPWLAPGPVGKAMDELIQKIRAGHLPSSSRHPDKRSIAVTREIHHGFARLVAIGCGAEEVAAMTDGNVEQLRVLFSDPSFCDLVAYYREKAEMARCKSDPFYDDDRDWF
jgi:hypothetical protein